MEVGVKVTVGVGVTVEVGVDVGVGVAVDEGVAVGARVGTIISTADVPTPGTGEAAVGDVSGVSAGVSDAGVGVAVASAAGGTRRGTVGVCTGTKGVLVGVVVGVLVGVSVGVLLGGIINTPPPDPAGVVPGEDKVAGGSKTAVWVGVGVEACATSEREATPGVPGDAMTTS